MIKDIVVGRNPNPGVDRLYLIPRTTAERNAQIMQAIRSSRTVGDLERQLPEDAYQVILEGFFGSEEHDIGTDDTVDNEELKNWLVEDWNVITFPENEMVAWVPAEIQKRYGEPIGVSFTSGLMLIIPVQHENEVVTALERHGFTCTRDQELIVSGLPL